MKKCLSIFFLLLFFFFTIETSAKNLPVPFTSQAPFGVWSEPWENACEEASILMVDQFYAGNTIPRIIDKSKAREAILDVIAVKDHFYGKSFDESALKVANLINEHFSWSAELISFPTIEQIIDQIDKGQPVIMPVHGTSLTNPYFSGPVDYHMVVLSGYNHETKTFIVQEPGTRHGLDWEYGYDTLFNAMHDFVPKKKTFIGKPVALFTRKKDKSTLEVDTDKDGFSDTQELYAGYSSLINEYTLPNGTLIKKQSDSKVYILKDQKKHHIISAAVFLSHGWSWSAIIDVSARFLSETQEGCPITQ